MKQKYLFLLVLIILFGIPITAVNAAEVGSATEPDTLSNSGTILKTEKMPSFFSYCIINTDGLMGSFQMQAQCDSSSNIDGYRIEIMPYSDKFTNIVISECHTDGDPVDIIAAKAENVIFNGDVIAINYTSPDNGVVIKIKQFNENEIYLRYYTNGGQDNKISGTYKLFTEPEPEIKQESLYLDKYTEKIDIDLGLSAYARWYLGISYEYPLTEKLLSMIKDIAIFDYPVKSLVGIEYFTNLKHLSISSGGITDITGLTKLKKLERIDISWCYIDTLPDLSGNTKLTELRLPMNNLTDISNVSKLTQLQYLDLNSNKIEDISPVKDLKKLKMLSVIDNCILNFEVFSDNKSAQAALESGSQFKYEKCLELNELAKTTIQNEIMPLITEGMSDLEKEMIIFEYVCDNMEYTTLDGMLLPFGYAGLKEHKGVCGNYAELFMLLSRLIGLDTATVSSETHEWNAIRINGQVYYLDTLWDQNNIENGCYYFNRTADEIKAVPDHFFDEKRVVFSSKSAA